MAVQAVQADEDMVYILLRDNSKQQFLCVNDIKMAENKKIEFDETMFLQLDNSPKTKSFIETFFVSNAILNGILIHNETDFTQIYDDPVLPGIKHVTNYLQNIKGPFEGGSVLPG